MVNQTPVSHGQIHEPEMPDYIKLRRTLGWVIIVIVAASSPFLVTRHLVLAGILTVVAVGYNSMLYGWAFIKRGWLASQQSILLFDSILIVLLIMLSNGGTTSPYISLLLFPIISAAIWHGVATSLAIDMGTFLALAIWQLAISPTVTWPDIGKSFGFLMFIFMVIGAYAAQLTFKERRQKHDIADKDFQIDQERKQLLALINNIGDAVLIVDQAGIISLFNEMTARLTGSQYALVGKPIQVVFPFQDDKGQTVNLLEITSTGTLKRRDLKLELKDSSVIDVEADISPYIVNQESHGYIIILRDITKEKTLEEEQQEFISVASHELRTPLTIAEANISNSLASPNAPTDITVRTMLNQAQANIMFLSNIINDLTTLSKAEQAALEVDFDPLNPGDLIKELIADFNAQAQAKNLAIIVNVSAEVKPILTSRYRIKQILQNFVSNALKYTNAGSITIAVENAPNPRDGVVFSVSDTGIGISVSDQKKVFTKFFRSEDYKTRESGGTGLGLYISAKLADRLNGKIWFESELKKGSTFYVQVPPYSQLKQDYKKVIKAEAENFFGTV